MHAATVSAIRAAEQEMVRMGDNFTQLMDRAGTAAAIKIAAAFPSARRTVILCGKGNNGGDGLVIARRLYAAGHTVCVVLLEGEPTSPQSFEQLMLVRQLPITVSDSLPAEADLYIDAVYGIGFHGRFSDAIRAVMRTVNDREGHKAAVDIPSGLQADSGMRDPDTFRADLTVTFIAPKIAMLRPDCEYYLGKVICDTIEVPFEEEYPFISGEDIRTCFTPRVADSHKGTYGRLLAVCGSYGMTGAAMLAGEAALRCGVGLLTMAVPQSIYPIVAPVLPEAVFLPCDGTPGHRPQDAIGKADAVLIGCGCGIGEDTTAHVAAILDKADCPVILDADGINCAALHIDIQATERRPILVTPHPAEMSRLLGTTVTQIQADRVGAAVAFCEKSGAVVVLKGHHTVIAAPGQPVCINPTGNPGMATGGSGDVLAGMIASFVAQGMSLYDAARCGVFLHGAAGDIAANVYSQRGMLPRDILKRLPFLLAQFE